MGLGAIWMQRIDMGSKNGRFIEICSLTRRSHPVNATGHRGATRKECVSVVLPKEQRRGGVILGEQGTAETPLMATSEGWRGP